MRVVVAMSGGVDSSVAAALLAEQGHDVVGVSMQLYDQRRARTAAARSARCCSLDDLHDARRVAAALGIPHYVLNFERQFDATVVDDFVAEYAAGPHADSVHALQQRPEVRDAAGCAPPRSSASVLATGHYARVGYDEDGRRTCCAAASIAAQGPVVFPLRADAGAARAARASRSATSTRPRSAHYARGSALPVADKPDSQEICFVPDGDYAAFVERRDAGARDAGGAFVDVAGHESSARTAASTASPSASARASACRRRRRSTSRTRRRRPARRRSAREAALERTALDAGEV